MSVRVVFPHREKREMSIELQSVQRDDNKMSRRQFIFAGSINPNYHTKCWKIRCVVISWFSSMCKYDDEGKQ